MYVWRLFGTPIRSERIFPGGPEDTWYSPNLKLKAKAEVKAKLKATAKAKGKTEATSQS